MLQRLAAPVYARMPDGCHIDRDTVESLEGAGFAIEECERFMCQDGTFEPAIPNVIGRARSDVEASIDRSSIGAASAEVS